MKWLEWDEFYGLFITYHWGVERLPDAEKLPNYDWYLGALPDISFSKTFDCRETEIFKANVFSTPSPSYKVMHTEN